MANPANQNNQNGVVEERRKFLRLNINVDIRFSLVKDTVQIERKSKSVNISAGGICIMTGEPLKAGDLLKLEIILPENPPLVQAIGKVAWVKSFSYLDENVQRYDVGVEFVEIDEHERQRVNKYVFSLR